MFLATINKPKRLVHLSFIGRVDAQELAQGRETLAVLLAEMPPGFRLLTDLERLDFMGLDCETEIGRIMELCDQKKVTQVVRVIPDPQKDLGLNILSFFHYAHPPPTATCHGILEAGKVLSL